MHGYNQLNHEVITALFAAIPEPFFIFDEHGTYVQIIGGSDRNRYHDGRHLIGRRIHDVMANKLADAFVAQIQKAILSQTPRTYTYQLSAGDIKGSENLGGPSGRQWFEAHIAPIETADNQPRMVVWIAFNITALKKTLKEKDALIQQLQSATTEINALKGILPICCHCKNIKDSNGDWDQLESYIQKHSHANFSHGICPVCAKKYYPDYDIYD